MNQPIWLFFETSLKVVTFKNRRVIKSSYAEMMNSRKTIPGSPASQTQLEHHRVERLRYSRGISDCSQVYFFEAHESHDVHDVSWYHITQMASTTQVKWEKLNAVGLCVWNVILSSHIFIWQEPWFPHLWYLWSLTMAIPSLTFVLFSSNSKGFLIFCTSEHEETDSKSV